MPRKKQAPRNPTSPATATLALSELHFRAAALEQEHQWFLKQIKRKRTELKNFVEQMREVATAVFHRSAPVVKKLSVLDQEIHALFNEIFTTRKLGKQTQRDIEGIYRSLQRSGLISPKSRPDEEDEEDFELDELFEEFRNQQQADNFSDNSTNSHHQHQPFAEPNAARTDESRRIRQTFLKLAEIFHPDKVTDSESQMRHTEIMKELNRAYQEGDLARLLEIEQQHGAGEIFDSSAEDDLSRKCQKLEQHNLVLKNQYETLKRELRLSKNTPEGALVSEYRQAVREGIDPIEQMVQEMEREIQMIEEIRDFVLDFRDKKMTIKEFLKGPECLRKMSRAISEKLFEEMFGVPVTVIF